MLIAMLGICSKEELDEEEEELEEEAIAEAEEGDGEGLTGALLSALFLPHRLRLIKTPLRRGGACRAPCSDQEQDSRGRQDVQDLLRPPVRSLSARSKLASDHARIHREESESVSELKNVTGVAALPNDSLANGNDGIKNSITNFVDARKSDIDNEHLPPDLIDPEDFAAVAAAASSGEEGDTDVFGTPTSPGAMGSTAPTSPDLVGMQSPELTSKEPASPMVETPTSEKDSPMGSQSPSPVGSPVVGSGEGAGGSFRRHHRRQSSLGTTRTSPSTRRRSLENTISMIREAMSKNEPSMEELAEKVAGNESPRSPSSPRNSMTARSPPASPSPAR